MFADILNYVAKINIPDTRRVKGYIVFGEKYVTARRKRLWPREVYIYILNQHHSLAESI